MRAGRRGVRACACGLGCLPRSGGRGARVHVSRKIEFSGRTSVSQLSSVAKHSGVTDIKHKVSGAYAMNKFCKSRLCEIESYNVLIGRRVDVPVCDAVRLLVLILISVKLRLCRLDSRPVLGQRESFLDLDGSTSAPGTC